MKNWLMRHFSVLTMQGQYYEEALVYLLEIHIFLYCYIWMLLNLVKVYFRVDPTAFSRTKIPNRNNLREDLLHSAHDF